MAQKLIRDIPDEVMSMIEEKAGTDGMNAEAWIRAQLIKLAAQPTVKSRYAFKAYGPEGAFAQIRHMSDGFVQQGARNCSQEQFDAYQMAVNYVKRNDIGDRELAHDLLSKHFETVFETNQ
ncbi:MAG TPA: hypothetical protein VEL31_09675 [Ktedonobacteraceae bacterium]|nr:hypothetical protein [Ktedonobacteraceae bacterium]